MFAGKYFDGQRHFLASFTVEGGNLVLEGSILQRVEANKFEDPVIGGIVTFSTSNGTTQATVIYNKTITFLGTRIGDLHLDEAALSDYTGVYKSSELDASYKLSVEDGNLTLRMNWNPAIKLQPVVQNEFTDGDVTTLVFHRDHAKRVSGINVFAGWNGVIRNENFQRIN